MDKQQWIEFLTAAGVEKEDLRENYAAELSDSEMTSAMLVELNTFGDELKEFGINIRGHIFKIIDHAKKTEKEKSEGTEHSKNSPLKISPTKASSPPKERSKIEEFTDVIKTCKDDLTLLSAKALSIITHLEDKLTTVQKENDKVWSIIIVREQLENIDEEMNFVFYMPDKSTMIQKLKDDGYWPAGCLTSFAISKGASIHFVRWFYFLTYSNYQLCDQIRVILRSNNVEIVTFSALVARVYSNTSGRIHPDKNIGSAEIEEGLKMYGLTDTRLLECVGILNEIKNLPLSSQKHNNAPSPSHSINSSIASSPSPSRNSNIASSPSHSINSNIASSPSHSINANIVSSPSHSKNSNIASSPSHSINSSIASSPSPSRNSNIASSPSHSINANIVSSPSHSKNSNVASSPSHSRNSNIASPLSSLGSSALMTVTHPPNVYPHSGLYDSSSSTGSPPNHYYHPYHPSPRTRRPTPRRPRQRRNRP